MILLGLTSSFNTELVHLTSFLIHLRLQQRTLSGKSCTSLFYLRLGILGDDCKQLPQHSLMDLTPLDIKKATNLLSSGFITTHDQWRWEGSHLDLLWREELETMLNISKKAEIEALSTISFNFLEEVYLLKKIDQGLWISWSKMNAFNPTWTILV